MTPRAVPSHQGFYNARMKPDRVRPLALASLALASGSLFAQALPTGETEQYGEFACRPLACSTLVPAKTIDDPSVNDCGYRNGNQWWVDSVAGSLAGTFTCPWSRHRSGREERRPRWRLFFFSPALAALSATSFDETSGAAPDPRHRSQVPAD